MTKDSNVLQEDLGQPDGSIQDLVEKVDYWKSVKKASESTENADKRFTENEYRHYRYELQPLGVMLGCGTVGVSLFVGSIFLKPNLWVHGLQDYTGFLRLAMMLLGAFCIFIAWPRHRDVRITPEEEEATEATRESISRIVSRDQ